jgi:hypothetical protein
MKEQAHRASMGRIFTFLVLLLPSHTWGQLTVEPGRGVKGVVYLSDTVHSARCRNTNECVTVTMAEYYSPDSVSPERSAKVEFGLLGIAGKAPETNAALTSIEVDLLVCFSVDSSRRIVCGELIFGKGLLVSREAVTRCFGEVRAGTQREALAHLQKGVEFALKVGSHGECLYYPTRGVMFDLDEKGAVRRLVVTRATPRRS